MLDIALALGLGRGLRRDRDLLQQFPGSVVEQLQRRRRVTGLTARLLDAGGLDALAHNIAIASLTKVRITAR